MARIAAPTQRIMTRRSGTVLCWIVRYCTLEQTSCLRSLSSLANSIQDIAIHCLDYDLHEDWEMIIHRQSRSHLIVSLDRLLQIRDTKPSIDERNVRLRQKRKDKRKSKATETMRQMRS